MGEKEHRPLYIALIVSVPVFFSLICFFNAMAASDLGQSLGLFLNSTANIAFKYDTEIQPSGWTFSIWGLIYAWQTAWIIYSLTTICRSGVDGYLYYSPPLIPTLLYLSYIINNILNIAWLITWDRELLPVALVVLAFMTFTLYICLFASFRAMMHYEQLLIDNNMKVDVWCVKLLVQNGLAVYAGWVSIATLINLSVCLVYNGGLTNEVACTICLSILTLEIVVWVSLDTFLLDRYTRYLVAPHFVIVFALSGVVDKNYVSGSTNSIFSAVLLALGIAALACKVTCMILRHIYVHTPTVKEHLKSEMNMAHVVEENSEELENHQF